MSRYLRRVLARTTGRSPGALQAARPHRWSSPAADPFAAADADVRAGDRAATPIDTGAPGRAPGGERPVPPAAPARIAAGAVDDAPGMLDVRSRPRRILDRAVRPDGVLTPPERRGVRRDAPTSAGEPTGSTRAPAIASDPPAAPRPSSAAAPVLAPPAIPRPGAAVAERRAESSTISMPPPMAPRRDPAAAAPVESRAQTVAVGELRSSAPAAAPIQPAIPPPPAAAARPEIVIGRISVVVDGARPPAAAPRTIIRRVTAAASAADDSGGSPRFGRFGLGQL